MKENWTYKKLGEVFNLQMGKTPARDNPLFWTGGNHKWISIGDLNCGKYISKTKECITDAAISQAGISVIPKGTVVMSFKLSIGKTAITMEDMYSNEAIMAFHLKERTNILPDYLCYYLPIHKWDANRAAMGSTLNKRTISESVIPLPPLSEQESIVRELDLLNDLIAKKRAQVAEYDQLQQSLFYTMFGDPVTNEKGWEVKKLGEVGVGKLTYGSGASAVTFDGEIRYIRITDITDIGGLNDNLMSPNVYDERYLLNDGDILFARTGATVGKTYCHSKKNGRCIYAGYLIRLRPNKEIVEPLYVFHFTKSQYYLDFVSSSQRAVAQPNINAQQYGELKLPLPPLPLQQEFARKVEAIEALKEKVNASIKETETLLAARMDYYFG